MVKLSICIAIVEIWSGIANGQIWSIFDRIICLRHDNRGYYEGPAKSFVTGFGLLQCYILSNIFLLQTFKIFPLYTETHFGNLFTQSRKADK